MSEILKKRIKKIIIISVCVLGGGYILFNFVFNFIIRQEAPLFDGIWSNEDGSFVLNTDKCTATVINQNGTETLRIAHDPGINFIMFYPPPEGEGLYAGDYIHEGDIYRIFDSIYVKCKDGCFDTWLQKVE